MSKTEVILFFTAVSALIITLVLYKKQQKLEKRLKYVDCFEIQKNKN